MASQLSSETKMDEKMDSSTSTETTGKAGRSIPPPLFSLENLYEVHNLGGDQNRHRSCTNTSLDSSSNCSLATTANTSTAPGTPYLVTPTGHHQQQQIVSSTLFTVLEQCCPPR
ncbi:hypothetical protein TYRP_013738 [Tyrophagus putrescentiae]|nr:hypothetical protein TYRP_013738 [Tyrophagus putrescentiae]